MTKTIQDLKKMISEPASKEWFKKHGTPKGHSKAKALHKTKEDFSHFHPNFAKKLKGMGYTSHKAADGSGSIATMKK